MSTELVSKEANGAVVPFSDSVFQDIATATSWLPRVQFFVSTSTLCKKGLIPMNHYGLIINKNELVDLGKNIDVLPCAWRPKAMRFGENNSAVSVFKTTDPEFNKIRETADTVRNSNCLYGPEFLIWLIIQKKFATLFLGNKSSRNESPSIKGKLDAGEPCTLDSRFVETKKYAWQAIAVLPCSISSFEPIQDDLLAREVERFLKVPDRPIETKEETQEPVRAM